MQRFNQRGRCFVAAAVVLIAYAALPAFVFGGTGGPTMPWDTPLQTLLDSLTGSTGRIMAGLMFVIGGIMWGFTRHEEGAKRFAQAVIAVAIIFGAVQLIDLLAFTGALL